MGSYFGSKATSGLCQPIIAMMPPHTTYIETHLGGGAIMKRKPATSHSIGVDIDSKPLSQFKCDYQVELVRCCAHRFLLEYSFSGGELIYCDPPYLLETRTSARRYRYEYTNEDHLKLIEIIKTLPCIVILSGYPSYFYDEVLDDWSSIELQVMNQGGVRTEKLWFNFTIDRAHWAGYAGKNFTDRQRIKRKAQRWAKNYESLPKGERLAVLSSIMHIEANE